MLDIYDAKKRVYVYRIDIWMNIFIQDEENLLEEFY